MSSHLQLPQPDIAVPREVSGWLLLLCLILTFVYPATSLYHIFSHTIPIIISAHSPGRILLLFVYALVFGAVAVFSFVTGLKLWLNQTQRRRFCQTVPADVLDCERLLFSFLDSRN